MPTAPEPTQHEILLAQAIVKIADACRMDIRSVPINLNGPMILDLAEQTAHHVGRISERHVAVAEELGLKGDGGVVDAKDIALLAEASVRHLRNRNRNEVSESKDAPVRVGRSQCPACGLA